MQQIRSNNQRQQQQQKTTNKQHIGIGWCLIIFTSIKMIRIIRNNLMQQQQQQQQRRPGNIGILIRPLWFWLLLCLLFGAVLLVFDVSVQQNQQTLVVFVAFVDVVQSYIIPPPATITPMIRRIMLPPHDSKSISAITTKASTAATTTSSSLCANRISFIVRQRRKEIARSSQQQQQQQQRTSCTHALLLSASMDENDVENNNDDNNDNDEVSTTTTPMGIDVSMDSRLYRVRLSRATGIDWGTDLSFSFVYVRDMDPTGAAAMSGQIAINDQLCEVTPITTAAAAEDACSTAINLIGAPFDYVMNTFATLDKSVKEMDFVFFRGTRDELKQICSGSTSLGTDQETITVTVVINKGDGTNEMIRQLQAPVGVNVRELLISNGINVYQSITRWTNCKGKQLCGTCIVNIPSGNKYTNRKSMDESSTLRENPDTYRLSCILFAYGDITVETFPPINAAQWTR